MKRGRREITRVGYSEETQLNQLVKTKKQLINPRSRLVYYLISYGYPLLRDIYAISVQM